MSEEHEIPHTGAVTGTVVGNSAYHYDDFAHVLDPKERRRLALAEIDKAPFGWYHVRYAYPPAFRAVVLFVLA